MNVISVENGRIAEHDALTLTVSWVKVLGKIRIRPPYSIYRAQMRKEKLDTIDILNGRLIMIINLGSLPARCSTRGEISWNAIRPYLKLNCNSCLLFERGHCGWAKPTLRIYTRSGYKLGTKFVESVRYDENKYIFTHYSESGGSGYENSTAQSNCERRNIGNTYERR